MYQKSVNAGSQTAISRRGSSLAEMNGTGHDSEMGEARNVNIVTNISQTTGNVGKHQGTDHTAKDGKHCLHSHNVVRWCKDDVQDTIMAFLVFRNYWTRNVNLLQLVISLPLVRRTLIKALLKMKSLNHSRPS